MVPTRLAANTPRRATATSISICEREIRSGVFATSAMSRRSPNGTALSLPKPCRCRPTISASCSGAAGSGSLQSRSNDRSRRYRPLGALREHPVAGPHVRPIVPDREVLSAAVVPHGDRMRRPAKAHGPMRPFQVVVQEVQHAAAFPGRYLADMAGEFAVDEEHLAAALRVADDDRMHRGRIGILGLVEGAGAVVRRGLAFEIGLHRRAEFLVGLVG